MPLPDLLWACPVCGRDRGLDEGGPEYTCAECGTAFRRVRGARIEARTPDGRRETRSPPDWVDRLPGVDRLLEAGEGSSAAETIRTARITARRMTAYQSVRARGRFLNRVEQLGPGFEARLRLTGDALYLSREAEQPRDSGGESPPPPGPDTCWKLEELTAVQTSSSSLQVNSRSVPLHDFRFHDDSIYLWEMLLRRAIRTCYAAQGRGSIVEFQPRITTGP